MGDTGSPLQAQVRSHPWLTRDVTEATGWFVGGFFQNHRNPGPWPPRCSLSRGHICPLTTRTSERPDQLLETTKPLALAKVTKVPGQISPRKPYCSAPAAAPIAAEPSGSAQLTPGQHAALQVERPRVLGPLNPQLALPADSFGKLAPLEFLICFPLNEARSQWRHRVFSLSSGIQGVRMAFAPDSEGSCRHSQSLNTSQLCAS